MQCTIRAHDDAGEIRPEFLWTKFFRFLNARREEANAISSNHDQLILSVCERRMAPSLGRASLQAKRSGEQARKAAGKKTRQRGTLLVDKNYRAFLRAYSKVKHASYVGADVPLPELSLPCCGVTSDS